MVTRTSLGMSKPHCAVKSSGDPVSVITTGFVCVPLFGGFWT
jgi:hypothetical protein